MPLLQQILNYNLPYYKIRDKSSRSQKKRPSSHELLHKTKAAESLIVISGCQGYYPALLVAKETALFERSFFSGLKSVVLHQRLLCL